MKMFGGQTDEDDDSSSEESQKQKTWSKVRVSLSIYNVYTL